MLAIPRTLPVALVAAALVLIGSGPVLARPADVDCEASRRTVQAEIDAACPCDGGSNHSAYVRCVTDKLRDLSACTQTDGKRSCGPVPRLCAAKIRRVASRSACGEPAETVTCCLPKQRDCVGDSKPGDDKKDGTCSGTQRRCDRITECLVSKCELAANADRCKLVGGTVGTGRDCASACE
jgi:hypothetical protein